jgi:prolyl oligopeptidase
LKNKIAIKTKNMNRLLPYILLLSMLSFNEKANAQGRFYYPATQTVAHVDTYFNTPITDPYQWLEDENSQATKQWITSQQQLTNSYLAGIPNTEKIQQRLQQLWNYEKISTPFYAGGAYFFSKNDGLQNQSMLYTIDALDATPRLLINPNTWSNDGTQSLTGYSVSHDGKYIAYGKSQKGSDWITYHIMDIKTQTILPDVIENIKFTSASWYKNGFYYSRYDNGNSENAYTEKNTQCKVYYHEVGTTQSADALIYEDAAHPEWSFGVDVTESKKHLVMYVSKSTDNNAISVLDLSKNKLEFEKIIDDFDHNYSVLDSENDALIVQTNYQAPNGKVVKINLNKPAPQHWETLIPEATTPIEAIQYTGKQFIVSYLKNIQSLVNIYNAAGEFENTLSLPDNVIAAIRSYDKSTNSIFYSYQSYVIPPINMVYNFDTKESKIINQTTVPIDLEPYHTIQKTYTSKDGTPVVMFITCRKNINLDGNNPTMLYGYGGFNIAVLPDYAPARMAFIEQGGVWVVANIRGGSEHGEAWHKAGMLLNKQNVFDDFISAAEYLFSSGYTNPQKLAIQGRSNGGLLVGAVVTQRPDICKVALPIVGVLDMLRYHKFTIGYFWKDEYGSSDDETGFKNIIKYSPLHNVKYHKYPATLVMTGDHDDRVVPAHSFKFASQLQAKQQGDLPCLIRIDSNAGHGSGKPTAKSIQEWSDLLAFTMYHLGIDYTLNQK